MHWMNDLCWDGHACCERHDKAEDFRLEHAHSFGAFAFKHALKAAMEGLQTFPRSLSSSADAPNHPMIHLTVQRPRCSYRGYGSNGCAQLPGDAPEDGRVSWSGIKRSSSPRITAIAAGD